MSGDISPKIEELARHEALASVPLEDRERVESMAAHVRGLLRDLDIDLTDPNMLDTDLRVAKMYLEMFHGLKEGAEPKVTTFPNERGLRAHGDGAGHPFYSMCAHHLVPFYGKAHIAYIPGDGISVCPSSSASSSSTPSGPSCRSG